MPQITLDLPFEKNVETVKGLSEEEREKLFFAVNEDYAKALGKMKFLLSSLHKKSVLVKDLNEFERIINRMLE